MKRAVVALVVLASTLVVVGASPGNASGCKPRTLIVSAMPVELGPLLADMPARTTTTVAGHDYYVGKLRGHDAVLTLTGIGPVNATRTTTAALAAFGCVKTVLFSGVAGGDYIGNVVVPASWTLDAGKHVLGVDRGLLAAARKVAAHRPALETTAPAGDPACGCLTSPDAVTTVAVTHAPAVEVGGTGQTTDPFSGRALPCAPGGGDVFGCAPCAVQTAAARDGERFVPGVVPFVDPAFFSGYAATSASEGPGYVVEDEETAAVDAVATAHHVRFLGIRAVSDGAGDPLSLPGFPAQFFYYRQLAADNAATVTEAILTASR